MSLSDTDQYFYAIIFPQLHQRQPRDIPQNNMKHSKSMKIETHTNKNGLSYRIQNALAFSSNFAKAKT